MSKDNYTSKVEKLNDLLEDEILKLKKDNEELQKELFHAIDVISCIMEGVALDYLEELKGKPKPEKKLKEKMVQKGKELKTITGDIEYNIAGRFTPVVIAEAVYAFLEADETLKKIIKRTNDYRDELDGKKSS